MPADPQVRSPLADFWEGKSLKNACREGVIEGSASMIVKGRDLAGIEKQSVTIQHTTPKHPEFLLRLLGQNGLSSKPANQSAKR